MVLAIGNLKHPWRLNLVKLRNPVFGYNVFSETLVYFYLVVFDRLGLVRVAYLCMLDSQGWMDVVLIP